MGTDFKENSKDELMYLRKQAIELKARKINHQAKVCEFLRHLSGENNLQYSKLLGISHTYLRDLELGNRGGKGISDPIKEKMAEVSGLSYEVIKYIFDNENLDINNVEKLMINFLEQYFQQQIKLKQDVNSRTK